MEQVWQLHSSASGTTGANFSFTIKATMFHLVPVLSLMKHFLLAPPQPSCVSTNTDGKLPVEKKNTARASYTWNVLRNTFGKRVAKSHFTKPH